MKCHGDEIYMDKMYCSETVFSKVSLAKHETLYALAHASQSAGYHVYFAYQSALFRDLREYQQTSSPFLL